MVSTNRPIAIDLFSGVGGLSLGLEQAGFDVAVKVEIEEIAGRFAQYNFPRSKVLHGENQGDVRKFGAAKLKELGISSDDVFLIAGGPPCQGFSMAGRRRKDDPLNDLVVEFARVVGEIRPKVFLMENVPGLKTSDSNMLRKAMKMLGKDYEIAAPTTLNAWDFGVPQMRRRVFLLGILKDEGIRPSLPTPITHRIGKATIFTDLVPGSWEAIHDIPPVDDFPELLNADRIPYTTGPESDYARIMRGVEDDPDDYSFRVEWDDTICTNLRRTQHSATLTERLRNLEYAAKDAQSRLRRLHPEDISTTIRAGTTKARGSWSAPRPVHPFQPRVLTTRECARIQSFPDWMEFHPVKLHGNRMVGNAVPPLLARAVGRHIRELFDMGKGCRPDETLTRDFTLIEQDVVKAAESNYRPGSVSQQVVSWKNK